jgi:hypothetical protein
MDKHPFIVTADGGSLLWIGVARVGHGRQATEMDLMLQRVIVWEVRLEASGNTR